jgi:hypothetical protein
MMKQTNNVVYVRKEAQNTLRELSEKTRLSQSQILADWLESLQTIMDKFPESYRITLMSFPTEKNVVTLIAPVLAAEIEFKATNIEKEDSVLAEKAVRADIEKKVSDCGLSNCGQHMKVKP